MAGFRKAKAEQAAAKIGIYGPTGSGKTFTALLLAEGLAKHEKTRIAYVDTERGTDFYCQTIKERKTHPEAFDFDAIYTKSLTEVIKEVKAINFKDHKVIVIDSITHLWEAAMNAYQGRVNRAGQIPMHAWGKIKKPYKDLLSHLLATPAHVFILGREGNRFEDDDGELKMVGKKMKAEGETPYEPHILIQMQPITKKDGQTIITCFGEKDRTGIIANKTIAWPSFDNIIKPMLPYLGEKQASVESLDEIAAKDAEELDKQDEEFEKNSTETHSKFRARMQLATNQVELKKITDELTKEVKSKMLTAHVNDLRAFFQELSKTLPAKGAA